MVITKLEQMFDLLKSKPLPPYVEIDGKLIPQASQEKIIEYLYSLEKQKTCT